jgi:hypothetical protein
VLYEKKIMNAGERKEWDKIVIDYNAFTASGLPANVRVVCTDGDFMI